MGFKHQPSCDLETAVHSWCKPHLRFAQVFQLLKGPTGCLGCIHSDQTCHQWQLETLFLGVFERDTWNIIPTKWLVNMVHNVSEASEKIALEPFLYQLIGGFWEDTILPTPCWNIGKRTVMCVKQNQHSAYCSKLVQSGPLPVIHGVIATINGIRNG